MLKGRSFGVDRGLKVAQEDEMAEHDSRRVTAKLMPVVVQVDFGGATGCEVGGRFVGGWV